MIPNATEAAKDQLHMIVTSEYIVLIEIWTVNVSVMTIGQARIVVLSYLILIDVMIDDINALVQPYMTA